MDWEQWKCVMCALSIHLNSIVKLISRCEIRISFNWIAFDLNRIFMKTIATIKLPWTTSDFCQPIKRERERKPCRLERLRKRRSDACHFIDPIILYWPCETFFCENRAFQESLHHSAVHSKSSRKQNWVYYDKCSCLPFSEWQLVINKKRTFNILQSTS